ncbi:MAG: hypothetical protein FJ278_18355, partial [Planctomycetes bacterium]|nr:hypothetical protein [Planctomycetota bacterium]
MSGIVLLCALSALAGESAQPVGPNLLGNGDFEAVDSKTQMASDWHGFSSRDWGDCAGTVKLSTEQP